MLRDVEKISLKCGFSLSSNAKLAEVLVAAH
jgi:hypothetical protein